MQKSDPIVLKTDWSVERENCCARKRFRFLIKLSSVDVVQIDEAGGEIQADSEIYFRDLNYLNWGRQVDQNCSCAIKLRKKWNKKTA